MIVLCPMLCLKFCKEAHFSGCMSTLNAEIFLYETLLSVSVQIRLELSVLV